MTDAVAKSKSEALRGRKVEDAAVAWVMEFERRHGRVPTDQRYKRAYPGDVDSPPRVIEIKATATSFRGWFLPLEPIQVKHASTDPNFHLYVVENVGQGDPSEFTLRVISGEHLQRLVSRATDRHYFEVPWPTKDYDATPIETLAEPIGSAPPAAALPTGTVSGSGSGLAVTLAEAIREALEALGGEAAARDVAGWIVERHLGRRKDVYVAMADLTYPGNASSTYPADRRFLERVSLGRYRLRR